MKANERAVQVRAEDVSPTGARETHDSNSPPDDKRPLSPTGEGGNGTAIVLRPNDAGRERDVTINIAMLRALHRRCAVPCAALEISLKEALLRAVKAWTGEHYRVVISVLETGEDPELDR